MFKNLDRWLGSYVGQEAGRVFQHKDIPRPIHVMFCCVDHFEPDWNKASLETQKKRVERWVKDYPLVAKNHGDAEGRHPKHSFFYPAENYNKDHLDLLSQLCMQGMAEVDIHLHHDNDTEDGLRQKIEKAKKDFASHGLLGRRSLSGQVRFAFIHGNWALNNSRKDGRWCGVNHETKILSDLGCYADFTYPSAPSETQPKKINSIYYCKSRPDRPKSHNVGMNAKVGRFTKGDLLVIQGPLALNWHNRSKGIFPRIENGEISRTNPPTARRVDLWIDQRISVAGRPNWIFVKIHTHGAPEKNADVLLGGLMREMYSYLELKYNDGRHYVLHYVTAREMYNMIKAAEAGEREHPSAYRDYLVEFQLPFSV